MTRTRRWSQQSYVALAHNGPPAVEARDDPFAVSAESFLAAAGGALVEPEKAPAGIGRHDGQRLCDAVVGREHAQHIRHIGTHVGVVEDVAAPVFVTHEDDAQERDVLGWTDVGAVGKEHVASSAKEVAPLRPILDLVAQARVGRDVAEGVQHQVPRRLVQLGDATAAGQ